MLHPDASIFRDYRYRDEHILPLIKNYTFLNTGLSVIFNGKKYISRGGLRGSAEGKHDQ